MKKILLIVGVILGISIVCYMIANIEKKPKEERTNISHVTSEKVSVVTTLFPQYDFAKEIGGDKVEVTLLLPPGVEAHSYEPKPSDITRINNADVFVYTGEFKEPWVHDIAESTDEKVKIVDVSKGIKMIEENKDEDHEDVDEHEHEDDHSDHGEKNETDHHGEEEKEEHDHDHGGVDPHIWLDFENAKIIAENIAKALSEVDSQNAEYYENNLREYQKELSNLDNNYRNTLASCKSNTIVHGGHYAFGYMSKRYNLKYIAAQGFSPDSEPSAKDMIRLTEQIKKDNIKHIFYEELTSPKVAETLSNETDTELLLLNGAHNLAKKDYEANISFISIMEKNLENLSLGLRCQK